MIRPDHCVWAIILTPPFELIDLKKDSIDLWDERSEDQLKWR
jgi:hypothetical protein